MKILITLGIIGGAMLAVGLKQHINGLVIAGGGAIMLGFLCKLLGAR